MKREIIILAVPGVQLLDLSGPLDVFAEANRILQRQVYTLRVMSFAAPVVQASSGVRLAADYQLSDAESYAADTFLIAGSPDIDVFTPDAAMLKMIVGLCQRSRRFGSVCSGALLLAKTGLLNGKRVTTHWACAAALAAGYPEISVDADALYAADGPIRTAAGVTSGLDLALRLVEEDLGREVALDIAGNLVMFFRRPVNQTHFMRGGDLSLTGRTALQDLQRWSINHLDTLKSVAMMAAHIHLSERHLTRLFRQQINMTPRQWLERERVAKAKLLLTEGKLPAKTIAARCGFSGPDVMRRAFTRMTGMTPVMYSKLLAER